ncbi:MAG: deoxyguanosinetriphosphate triphosphohydrolase, partial [Clostridia bacterium]|nr:deoxyguanosinetriphosphate triphosphohydrolase [Clostridia bacterium]
KFMFKNVYFSSHASAEEVKAKEWLVKLYDFLKENPDEVPEFYRNLSMVPNQYLLDYIAGMTDTFVIKLLEKYFNYKWDSIL